MTEFDFDELDRAVNNLMTDVDTSKRSEGLDDPEEKTVELADTQDQSLPASVAPSVMQPLAAKRRGRFMDVVRPSSGMSSPFPPKREGNVITSPVSVQSNDEVNTPSVDSNAMQDELPKEEAPLNNMNNLPDSHESQEPEATEQPSEIGSSDDEQSTDSHESTELTENDTNLPMESPFLADAKVEKRPLGVLTEPSEELGVVFTPETDESQAESSQPVEETPAPEFAPQELAPEIMNIESSPISQETPEQDTLKSAPMEALVAVESAAPTDIVPQYTESETHDSEPSGAIYDTAAYHQPLEHPAKKHSGWGIVVWILLLLIIGAVAGAAYFYFTTQY